jgi:hypothetical protein
MSDRLQRPADTGEAVAASVTTGGARVQRAQSRAPGSASQTLSVPSTPQSSS